MINMARFSKTYFQLFIVFFFLSCINRKTVVLSHDQQAVQKAVDSVRNALSRQLNYSVPSLNVLIQTPSQKIFVSSADSNQKPVTPDTYFRFASCTKNFTAASILKMYQDGWLNYKAKITDTIPGSILTYVPSTENWNIPYKNEISIEELLQHTAGVYDVDNDTVPEYGVPYVEYIQDKEPLHQFTADELVGVDAAGKLSYFKPGEGYHYSNTGYTILGEIIARVYSAHTSSHKSYSDYVYDNLTGAKTKVPLHVRFPGSGNDVSLPSPYVVGTELLPDSIAHFDQYNVSAHVAEGNGLGTVSDLNTYIRSLMKGQNVLNDSTVNLMKGTVSQSNKVYGLGCTQRENFGYGHNGAKVGYLSVMTYDPETDVSIVVLLPLWDLREGMNSFGTCFTAMYAAASAARKALHYTG